jgi:hypothetical protein
MSETQGKGRRAADRRRERQASDGPETKEPTTAGGASEGAPLEPEVTAGVDGTRKKRKRKDRVTSITSVTNVGSAAEAMLKEPLPERTKVRQLAVGPAQEAGRLICLEGKDVGKSFDLTHDVMVVGRSKDAQVQLSDPGISRAHFEVRYNIDNAQFYFIPSVTDPAPQLNGEDAAGGPRELVDGDVIEVGETALRFVRMEGAPPLSRETPPPPQALPPQPIPSLMERSTRLITRIRQQPRSNGRYIAAFFGAFVFLLAAGVWGAKSWRNAARESVLGDPAGSYQQLLKQANTLRESRRWDELGDTAKAATALAPERDDGTRLAQEAADEKLAERNLNLGRMYFEGQKYGEASGVLRLIGDSSVYRPERDGLLDKTHEVGRTASLAVIRRLLAEGRLQEAGESAEQHLSSYRDDPEGAALRSETVRRTAAREALGSARWQELRVRALASMETGDLVGALLHAEQGRSSDPAIAGAFVGKLKTLQQSYQEGKSLLDRKSPHAVAALTRAREAEEDLTGGQTAFSRDLTRALADAWYLSAVNHMAHERDCEGRTELERAAQLNGADSKTRNQLGKLTARAMELLTQAEAARAKGNHASAQRLATQAACRLSKDDSARPRAEKLSGRKG